jgi:hypothetical protein
VRVPRRLVILAVVLVAWPALAASAGGSARVWLQDTAPAVVRGAGFHSRETVVVTVSAGAVQLHRRTTSTATGSFVSRFQDSIDVGCHSIFVAAVDTSGRRATLKIVPSGCGTQVAP